MENLSGTVIRGYELQGLLGEGGFGAVYRAYQPAIKRYVAFKVILPEYANNPEFIRSFESEAQIVARLEHLHIVPLYDFWREPDGAYLVMRLLPGGSLRQLIEKGPVEPLKIARILDQTASALAVAHRNKVIHRDIKPDNILLDDEGNAFLTDFGIAKDLEEYDDDDDGFADDLTGSPHYISPEQAQQEHVSPRSDIYSLGIVLFEMLTGSAPFAGNTTMMELILKQINDPLPPLSEVDPDLPEAFDLIIQQATAKDPDARYSDALSFARAFRRAIPGQVVAEEAVAEKVEVDEAESGIELTDLVVPSVENPYKGLRAFEEADADDFFGRDELIQSLTERMKEHRFLAVIGPSGSGKSSVVKAGLMPKLRQGALPGSKRWFIAEMVPGSNPFIELESALLSVAVGKHANLAHQLRQNETALLETVEKVLPGEDSQLLLVIDQFEETFTQSDDEESRAMFLNNLLVAVTNSNTRLRIIITMRADFYDRPLQYAGFGELIRRHSEVVLPLSPEEMGETIIKPAERAGLNVEPALASAIITEVSEQPGALPLLQYALTEVFERRKGDTLTYAAYQETGGVLGALARRAEEIYVQLDSVRKEIVRQMFLRLVTLGEGTEDTRRRISQTEILSISNDEEAANDALGVYSKYRLLTFDTDPVTRVPTAEVAHEALIREWQRLREWLDDSRDDVRVQQRLSHSATEWINQRRDSSFLASGMRLNQFAALLQSGNITLNEDEQAYTEASVAERDRQIAEEEERRARELRLERRAKRFLQAVVGVFVVATIVAVILAITAVSARNEAQENEEIAQQNEATAVKESELRAIAEAEAVEERNQALIDSSRTLSVIALQQLDIDPVASTILALRALPSDATPRPYTPEAEFALNQAMQLSLERVYLAPFANGPIQAATFGTDQIALGGTGLALTSYDLDGTVVLTGHPNGVYGVHWSDDDRLLSYDPFVVHVWDGEDIAASFESETSIACADWQPSGSLIMVCAGTDVQIWSPDEDTITGLRPFANAVINAAWSSDGRRLAAWDDTTLIVWDSETEETSSLQAAPAGFAISTAVWSPDGTAVAAIITDATAVYWSPDMDDPIVLEGHTAAIDGITFFGEEQILTFGNDGTARLWSLAGEERLVLGDGESEVNGVSPSPDGSRLLMWMNNGDLQVWDLATGNRLVSLAVQGSNVLNAAWRDNTYVATSDLDFGERIVPHIRIWDTDSGQEVAVLNGHTNRVNGMHWLDSERLMTYSDDGSIRIWEVFTKNDLPMGSGLVQSFVAHGGRLILDGSWVDNAVAVSSGRDGTATRWNLETGESFTLSNENNERRIIVWNPDGTKLLTYSREGDGQVWDIETQTILYDVTGPISQDSAFWLEVGLFIGHPDGTISWLDSSTGAVVGILEGHSAKINDAVYYSPRRLLATAGSEDYTVYVWNLPPDPAGETLQPISTLSQAEEARQPLRLAWHSDGIRLLSAGFNGDVQLWDTQSEEVLLFLTGAREFPSRRPAFSPDEAYFAVPIESDIFVWDFDGELIVRISGENAVLGVEWLQQADQNRLLTWDRDGFIRVWDISSGVEIWRVQDTHEVSMAAFNNNGSRILSVGGSGKLLVWEYWPDINNLIESAGVCCQTRSLSLAQQSEFNISE